MQGPALPRELGRLGRGCWQLLPLVYRCTVVGTAVQLGALTIKEAVRKCFLVVLLFSWLYYSIHSPGFLAFQNYPAAGQWHYRTYDNSKPGTGALVSWEPCRSLWQCPCSHRSSMLSLFLQGSLAFKSDGLCVGRQRLGCDYYAGKTGVTVASPVPSCSAAKSAAAAVTQGTKLRGCRNGRRGGAGFKCPGSVNEQILLLLSSHLLSAAVPYCLSVTKSV